MVNKVWAQIKNGVVENAIVLNDESLIPIFSEGFDYFVRIDEMDPRPGPQWLFDGQVFTNPDDQG